MATLTVQKSLGAYYTEAPAADRLVNWAIRNSSDTVLDPSCGDGVFLAAAHRRLSELGCKAPAIFGIDISPEAIQSARERVPTARLLEGDFFDISPELFRTFDGVLGNPPFIRYQTFNGNKDSKGHARAREAGVILPRLASSWAPFVVHASRLLRTGGRLAMVMPAELGHAMYAKEVLRFLIEHFRHVCVEMFRDKIFDGLNQSTILLYCDGYGESCRKFIIGSADDLSGIGRQVAKASISNIKNGRFRFTHYLVPERVRQLYEDIAATSRVERLGDVADIGIGYVTGANAFFHLSAEECRIWEIPKRFLRPCVLNLRGFSGIAYSQENWKEKRAKGEKVYLLALSSISSDSFPTQLQRYLKQGETSGIADRYKCRVRQLWYVVPHVRVADAFLSYMSGEQPLLVVNQANLVAPNTVHVLRFMRGHDPLSYAAVWRNSLTRLSCELEGHALGGGLFKLEPSEAESVLAVRIHKSLLKALLSELGQADIEHERAAEICDRYVLRRQLGLTQEECIVLREAATKVEAWRKHK